MAIIAYPMFTYRGQYYRYIDGGWCAKELPKKGCWRVFYGTVAPGCRFPSIVRAHEEGDGYVDFPTFEKCVQWVDGRR